MKLATLRASQPDTLLQVNAEHAGASKSCIYVKRPYHHDVNHWGVDQGLQACQLTPEMASRGPSPQSRHEVLHLESTSLKRRKSTDTSLQNFAAEAVHVAAHYFQRLAA